VRLRTSIFVVATLLLLLAGSSANGASVSAIISASTVNVGESIEVTLYLNLEPSEVASAAHVSLKLIDANPVAALTTFPLSLGNVVGVPQGWDTSNSTLLPYGSCGPGEAGCLFSEALIASPSRTGSLYFGAFELTAAAPGTLAMVVDEGDTWWGPNQFDQHFFSSGTIGTVTVTPEPSTALLMGLGLVGIATRKNGVYSN